MTTMTTKKGGSSDEEVEPDEFTITNPDGSETRMISTVAGAMPLDFNNTKMIQDGTVKGINEQSLISTAHTASLNAQLHHATSIKQMASYNKDGTMTTETAGSFATDIGLFKAGMDTIDQEEVKRVIADSSGNSEYYKT